MFPPKETALEETTGPLLPSGAQPNLLASTVQYTRLLLGVPFAKQAKRQVIPPPVLAVAA